MRKIHGTNDVPTKFLFENFEKKLTPNTLVLGAKECLGLLRKGVQGEPSLTDHLKVQ